MHIVNKVLGFGLLLGIAAGCRPVLDADLSPDGNTLAQATDKGLVLRPASGKAAGQTVLPISTECPRFSPDGKHLAVFADKGNRAYLVDVDGQKSKPLVKGLEPPFAWRPDGSELLTWKGDKHAKVVHIATGEVVRGYEIAKPDFIKWLPNGRDIVLGYPDHVTWFHGGKSTDVKAELERVQAVGGDAERAIWVEGEGLETNTPTGRLRIRSLDFATGEVVCLRDISKTSEITEGQGTLLPMVVSLSPKNDKIAISGLLITSPPEVWQRYLSLMREATQKGGDQTLKAEAKRLEAKLTFEANCYAMDLSGSAVQLLAKSNKKPDIFEMPDDLRWSADGTKVALVMPPAAKVVAVKP